VLIAVGHKLAAWQLTAQMCVLPIAAAPSGVLLRGIYHSPMGVGGSSERPMTVKS
jgi:hypothetical protein